MNEDNTPIGSTGAAGYTPPSQSGAGYTPPSQTTGTYGQSATERVAQKTEQTAESLRSQGEHLKQAAREKGAEAVENLKSGAQSAAHEAKRFGSNMVQEQKETLAHKVREYANAAHAASDRLRSDQDALAGPAERAAEQLDRMSDYLREKQPADLLDDLESFARRRPEIVFGGMFVAGLAAARFFKASRRTSRELSRGSYEYSGSPSYMGAASGGISTTSTTTPAWPSTASTVGSGSTEPRTGVGVATGTGTGGIGTGTSVGTGGPGIGAGSGLSATSTSSIPTTPGTSTTLPTTPSTRPTP